jgi:hypothetical protein
MTGTTRRVDPWGQLHERRQIGKLMGNRGKLDLTRPADRQLWDHQRWISCDPDYRPPGHPEGERIVFTLARCTSMRGRPMSPRPAAHADGLGKATGRWSTIHR